MKFSLLFGTAALALSAALPLSAQASAPPADATTQVPPIAYKQRILLNGLRVLSLQDSSTPNVMVSVWYGVGSKHDPDKRSGFAHLFEHILSRKTVNMPYNMINRLTEDVGGIRNASTNFDRTNYYETVPAQYLETMLWTHAERMALPVIDKEVFETERNVVKEELRQRVLSPPYGRLFRLAITENAFDVLPHRRPVIGSIADLDAATLEDARAFHEAFYGPDTATLIVAGNFDEARLQSLVDHYFGAIPKRATAIPLEIEGQEPPMAPRRINAAGPNVPLPVVGAIYKAPGAGHPDAAALEVMNAVLSSGQNSRLYKALVSTGLATELDADVDFTREAGAIAPLVILADGQDAEAVAAALDRVLAGLATDPVGDAELAEAKTELLAATLAERETFTGRAFELGEALATTGDPASADKRLAAIGRVTGADIARVAKKYLDPKARVEVRYTSGEGTPKSWSNPRPMPVFSSVSAAKGTPNELAAEAMRRAPPAPTAAPEIVRPTIADQRLSNGVRVVAVRTGSVPLATLSVVIGGGSSTDPAGRAGLAAMAAGLATKGTATRSAEEIASALESLGATIKSGATPDGSILSVTAPAANLAAVGAILADIVRGASYPQAEFDIERKRMTDGLRVAMRDPGAIAAMVAQPLLYGRAPYGGQAGGTMKSLAAISRADLVAYRRTWWHPSNLSVVVAGGIEPAMGTALSEHLFADWKVEGPAPVVPQARAGVAQPVRTIVVDLPGAGQAAVLAAVRGVSRGNTDYPALLLANSVLGVGSNGRLYTEVRSKRALSYGAYSSLAPRADTGLLAASAQTKNETTTEVAEIFLSEFKRLGVEPIGADALAKRRAFLEGAFDRQFETGGGISAIVSGLMLQGLQPADALHYGAKLGLVTPEATSAIAARMVTPERASLVVVGDASKFIDKLRLLRPELVVIPADKLDLESPTLGGSTDR